MPKPVCVARRQGQPPKINSSSPDVMTRQTKAKWKAETAAQAKKVLAGRCTVPFIDTLQVLLAKPMTSVEMGHLCNQNGGKVICDNSRSRQYPWLIRLQQPSLAAVKFLAQSASQLIVSRVDISLDVIAPSSSAADDTHRFLEQHITQPYRGQKRMHIKEETTYFAAAWKLRNIVIYSGRLSKMTGEPCCHLELRFYSAPACRRYSLGDLKTLPDCNVRTLLQRTCRFSTLYPPTLEKRFDELAGKSLLRRKPSRRRRAHPIAKLYGNRPWLATRVINHYARQIEPGTWDADNAWEAPVQLWMETHPTITENAVLHLPRAALGDALFGSATPKLQWAKPGQFLK